MAPRKSGTDQLFVSPSEKVVSDNSSRTENRPSGKGSFCSPMVVSLRSLAKIAGVHRQDYPVDVLPIRLIDSSHCSLACLICDQEVGVRERGNSENG